MKKLLNKTKKGFTLVELLVVIAILAVLASVSVIGYLGFVEKARNSDAVTELAQVRELLRAELIDGDVHTFSWTETTSGTGESTTTTTNSFKMQYINGDYYFLDLETSGGVISPATSGLTEVTTQFKKGFDDLSGLNATISVKLGEAVNKNDSKKDDNTIIDNDYKIEVITYARTAGGSAYWTVSGDTITAGAYSA